MSHKTRDGLGNLGPEQQGGSVCDGLWKRPIRGVPHPAHNVSAIPSSARQGAPANIGLEMEMFAYDAHSLIPLGMPGSIFHPSELLKRMSDFIEGSNLKVDPSTGVVVGLSLPSGANFSLEPGGRGADMMGHTCTVQPNIDITGDDSDWEDAVRLTFALTPAVQMLTKNSSYFAGKKSKYLSERQRIWQCTDKTRAGIPEGIARAQDVACHYAHWARQANVFLVRGLPIVWRTHLRTISS